ncbi:MAG: F0F1 ATP synthase subunit B [Woeseiaceae bacterium]|nr:F0F1 ATP synthase subunit B [Woeseiaceae bacterium]MDG1713113.1 F0F1 ATP synthase subunit B [Woeseiaceae bacterium]MDG1865857.1 F0F1 ATP synthase subunit B [Woeseiaceae bacterium]
MTLIGQSISMILFVWFCMKFIWPPLMEAIEERQAQIADGLAAGEQGQQKLDKANIDSQVILDDARKQATGILDQANARANEIVSDGKQDGQQERERQLSLAKTDIEQESNKARDELREQVAQLAIVTAEKILKREIDMKAHEDILSKLTKEL